MYNYAIAILLHLYINNNNNIIYIPDNDSYRANMKAAFFYGYNDHIYKGLYGINNIWTINTKL